MTGKADFKRLDKYISSLTAAPAQRSTEWYSLRQASIGGSEIATILGTNPYSNLKNMILEKIGVKSFSGSNATRWGSLFENVTKRFTEILFTCNIKETGSIEGVIKQQRYSPDGLAVVRLLNEDNEYEYYIALFEFKSPYSSAPPGSIPKHYIAQVQTGLLSIPLADFAIFVNNSYRKCALKDLSFNSVYDRNYHSAVAKKKEYRAVSVLATGLVCFYQTKAQCDAFTKWRATGNSSSEFDIYDHELLSEARMVDFGSAYYARFNRLLELVEKKAVSCWFSEQTLNNELVNRMPIVLLHGLTHCEQRDPATEAKKQLSTFTEYADSNKLQTVGYLPWKLLLSDVIITCRQEGWRELIEPKVNEAVELLNKINEAEDKYRAYREVFEPEEPAEPELETELEVCEVDVCDASDYFT